MVSAKATYQQNLLNKFAFTKDDIFKYINSITSHCPIPETIHYGSSMASSDLNKASLSNEFFHSTLTSTQMPLSSAYYSSSSQS